jgi:NADH-quinone oxidoreductase subunit L
MMSFLSLQAPMPTGHPLADTVAQYVWLLPVLPLLGFLLNGALSITAAAKIGPADPSAGGHNAAHDAHSGGPGADVHHSGGPGADVRHTDAHDDSHISHDDHAPVRHKHAALVSLIGPGVMVLAFGFAVAIFAAMRSVDMAQPYVETLFRWMPVSDLKINVAMQLDPLSMVMVLVITGVGALIHIFSVAYMQDDPGYPRYFAYLNLFVFFMLLLVLGANYPVMFVGWEGVGLCSYLLVGFWFTDKANADAGKKAFVMNRIGDFGFLIAMFLLFANTGSLDFSSIAANIDKLPAGGAVVTAICLFLFLGCTGKSAQIPLYTWLPDAMAGPTPVSALIHAATMVTAGVYLVARSSLLFSLAPVASLTVALVGGVTALFAATIGLKQWDIKKVLAYSTVSQLGYMFVGVGVGAYSAGIFHVVTHAFFKALLFLGSGSVIFAMHAAYHSTHNHSDDAQDMRNMGGLKTKLPITWVLMWIATLAIAGVPVFSGFVSKDAILGAVFERAQGSTLASASLLGIPGSAVLYAVYAFGLAGALLTAIYMTRMMLYTFHGPNRTGAAAAPFLKEAPWLMTGPLVVLGILSAVGGWLNLPEFLPLGPQGVFDKWLEPVVGAATARVAAGGSGLGATTEQTLIGIAVAIAIAGIAIAFVRLKPAALVPKNVSPAATGFEKVLENRYYVDEAYDRMIVEPVVTGSRLVLWKGVDVGLIDGLFVNGSALLARATGWMGSQLQSGQLGTYAWVLVLGVIALLGAFVRVH